MPSPFDGLIAGYGAPATLLAVGGVTPIGRARILLSNTKQVPLLGTNRGNGVEGFLAAEGSVTPTVGLVVVTDGVNAGISPGPAKTYLIAKVSDVTPGPAFGFACPIALLLLPLPLLLTAERANSAPVMGACTTPGRRTDAYGRPIARADGTSETVTHTIRVGLSTDLEQTTDPRGIGQMRTGILVGYTPLGSDIKETDVLLYDGERYSVTNVQLLAAEGWPFAQQIEIRKLTGGQTT